MKATTKRERNQRKALERSLRNQPPGFKPRRKVRRLAAKAGVEIEGGKVQELTREQLERKTVDELREICAKKGIAYTTKIRKPGLIEMIAGR